MNALFILVILLAFAFALTNGFIDGGGLVSPVITTRAMEPMPALLLVAACEIVGLFCLGHNVARTLAGSLLRFPFFAEPIDFQAVALCALLGAFSWNLTVWRVRLPSSSTHALVGGLIGAGLVRFGLRIVHAETFLRVGFFLAIVPAVGILFGFAACRIVRWIGSFLSPAEGKALRWLQIAAVAGSALVHGSNDGQKAAGMISLGAMASAGQGHLPLWIWACCGLMLALGVIFGSRGMIHTVGRGFYHMGTIEAFCAGASTATLIGLSSVGGYPMSTSHVMATSIVGAGAAVHPRGVRWGLAGEIALAWFVTIPAAALFSAAWMAFLKLSHVVS